jgi:hypothetical protein
MHKMRCAAFGKLFSPATIRRLEAKLKDMANFIIGNILERIIVDEQVNQVNAYSTLAQDLIAEYCFVNSGNVLEKPSFAPHWYDWMQVHCTFTLV